MKMPRFSLQLRFVPLSFRCISFRSLRDYVICLVQISSDADQSQEAETGPSMLDPNSKCPS